MLSLFKKGMINFHCLLKRCVAYSCSSCFVSVFSTSRLLFLILPRIFFKFFLKSADVSSDSYVNPSWWDCVEVYFIIIFRTISNFFNYSSQKKKFIEI